MWRVGHRGACGYAPENTLASVRKALEIGVHGFEFDIQLSADGVPMVIHDETLERTTNGAGAVRDFTLKELQGLDAGNGEKIPSLMDIINLVDKRCRLFIELKDENSAKPVVDILDYSVKNLGWSYEQFFVCSFNHLQIAETRALTPEIHTLALFVGIPVSLSLVAAEAGAWAISTAIDHTNQALVDDAHKRGLKSLVWTANTPAQIARAKSLKVDGIISDFPDRIV